MYLKDFFPEIEKISKLFFSNIAFNSSKVKKDFIFFAIKGNEFNGHSFIKDAIKKGLNNYSWEKVYGFKKWYFIYLLKKY